MKSISIKKNQIRHNESTIFDDGWKSHENSKQIEDW